MQSSYYLRKIKRHYCTFVRSLIQLTYDFNCLWVGYDFVFPALCYLSWQLDFLMLSAGNFIRKMVFETAPPHTHFNVCGMIVYGHCCVQATVSYPACFGIQQALKCGWISIWYARSMYEALKPSVDLGGGLSNTSIKITLI